MTAERAFENIGKWLPAPEECDGIFDIPVIAPVYKLEPVKKWDRFCWSVNHHPDSETGVMFFEDDFKFLRIWNNPDLYIPMLKKAAAVTAPDFSMYTDMPKIMQIYNHYRKHWMAAYWQDRDITVIPNIGWSTKDSLEWCFDGEPEGGIVAVSSIGTQRQGEEARKLFRYGYDAMMERLHPETILFWGAIPKGLKGNICPVELFYDYGKHGKKGE